MRTLAAVLAAVCALTVVPIATGHPQLSPGFVERGSEADLMLTAPNERKVPMTAIELRAPPTVELLAARSTASWRAELEGNVARWSGGRLNGEQWGRFPVRLRAGGEPGNTAFSVTQHFADGRTVDWPVALVVTPAPAAEPSRATDYGAVLAALAVAGVVAVGIVAVRRLRRPGVRPEA